MTKEEYKVLRDGIEDIRRNAIKRIKDEEHALDRMYISEHRTIKNGARVKVNGRDGAVFVVKGAKALHDHDCTIVYTLGFDGDKRPVYDYMHERMLDVVDTSDCESDDSSKVGM